MPVTRRQILARHGASLHGTLRVRFLSSKVLGLRKPYFVYEPPGAILADPTPGRGLPLLYLFRGHEREWVNIHEDGSRATATSIETLDRRIAEGALPPLIAVMPGLNSSNNHVPSLGIDMVGVLPTTQDGLGTGRFWRYLVDELFPRVARDYPEAEGGLRLAAGFSLGGYTASLLAVHRPGLFDHVGLYDGLLMWPDHHDPRQKKPGPCTDPIWCKSPLFDAALGRPRDPYAMRRWNPTDTLRQADGDLLAALRRTTFWINSAPSDGRTGNVDRARFFAGLLHERGVPVGFDEVVFDPDAAHTWHWTDRFLMRFLRHALDAA